jgi:uncharacterized protein (TIGR02646 family)
MIYINRDGKSPDQDWLDRADAATNSLLSATSYLERCQIIDANEALWRELKDFLLEISNQKCWYSEACDVYNNLHVDHFRPKKIALGIDKQDHGGYWWLAFKWGNYRVCGGAGNVRKKEKFAIRANKANDVNANTDDEVIYFLDPTEEEDPLKLTFNSSGEIGPLIQTGWDFERAEYTIRNLNLNFKKLKEARKILWVKCSTLVTETQDLMNQNNLSPSSFRKGQIKEKLRQLRELVDKTSPFSATAKACLRSTGIEWALAYAA